MIHMKKLNDNSNPIPSEIINQINLIQNDTTSGATEITIHGIQTVLSLLKMQFDTADQLLKVLTNTLHHLIVAQPTMASLFTYANNLSINLQDTSFTSIDEFKKNIHIYSATFLKQITEANRKISIHSEPIIAEGKKIFTYSSSSSVYESLIHAHNKGKTFTVHCSESRPKKEGIPFAKNLAKQGIQTYLSTDATLFSTIEHADLLLLGADSISHQGIYHKMGSKSLVQLASCQQVPVYSLSAEEKIVPKEYQIPKEPEKNKSDILSMDHENLQVENHYFDITPLKYFTGLITQRDILTPSQLINYIKHLTLHDRFKL